MSGLVLLSESQMARIAPHFPLAHGVPRVDDRRVISGIVSITVTLGVMAGAVVSACLAGALKAHSAIAPTAPRKPCKFTPVWMYRSRRPISV